MSDELVSGRELIDGDWLDDPGERARQIDALMAGPPAEMPRIIVFGDDAVFGINPIPRQAAR